MPPGTRSVAFAAIFVGVVAQASAAEDPAAEAKAALSPVLAEIVATSRDASVTPAAKRALIEHELAIWLDTGHMSAVALGPQAEAFSREQLAEFHQEFGRYLSDVYIRRIVRFREKEVELKRATWDQATGVATVRTLGGSPLAAPGLGTRQNWKARADVDYLLRKQRGEWRILAIRVEGVDLARSFREQFQAVLERSDPDALIAELRKRNAEREAQNPWE